MEVSKPLTPEDGAEETARKVFHSAIQVIDGELGTDYARKNPPVLTAVFMSMMSDVAQRNVLGLQALISGIGRMVPVNTHPS